MDELSKAYSRFVSSFDLASPNRKEWRNAVHGTERERLQTALLTMATDAFFGTERDLLGIYKAAHSVLPLKGTNLEHLATLLTKYPEDLIDWLDVFVEALNQLEVLKTDLPGQILQTLHNYVLASGETATKDIRFLSACRNIYRLGYRPNWMSKYV